MLFARKKNQGRVPLSSALVYAELPSVPRLVQPHVSEGTNLNSSLGRDPSSVSAPPLPNGESREIMSLAGGVASRTHYVFEFSDGQRVEVAARCVAGRNTPAPEDGYDAFAVLNDPSQQISRRHFEFGVTQIGQVWVKDCGSLNGTWLDCGGVISQLPEQVRVVVDSNDVLRFGGMSARLVPLLPVD